MKKHEYKYALDVRNNTYCLQFVMRRLWLLLLFFSVINRMPFWRNLVRHQEKTCTGNMKKKQQQRKEATTQSFLCCFLFSLKCCVAIFWMRAYRSIPARMLQICKLASFLNWLASVDFVFAFLSTTLALSLWAVVVTLVRYAALALSRMMRK